MFKRKLLRRLVKWTGLSKKAVTLRATGRIESMPAPPKAISTAQPNDHKSHAQSTPSPITKPNLNLKNPRAKR